MVAAIVTATSSDVASNVANLVAYKPWLYNRVPVGWWRSQEHQLKYVTWLREHLGLTQSLAQLYSVKGSTISRNHGQFLITNIHRGSVASLCEFVFPHHKWLPWRFVRAKLYFWASARNRRIYVDWLRGQLQMHTFEDMYRLSVKNLLEHDGRWPLGRYYGGSQVAMVIALYPEHPWLPWRFSRTPRRWWTMARNRQMFMDHVRNKHGVREVSDKIAVDEGGATMFYTYYKGNAAVMNREHPPEDSLGSTIGSKVSALDVPESLKSKARVRERTSRAKASLPRASHEDSVRKLMSDKDFTERFLSIIPT